MKNTKICNKSAGIYKLTNDAEIFINPSSEPREKTRREGGHTGISLKSMLVRAQISTTQRNRMTLNLNPQKKNDPKFKPRKTE